ncbi:bifunctional preprotein translocase subunit SecD/SecF [compost metagenome]
MLLGVIVGTYSSLFVAAPIVVDLLQRSQKNEPAPAVAADAAAAAVTKKVKA